MKIQYKYAVSLTAALALFMAVLDSTIVNVALVSMERDFKTTINAVQWVVTGYILVQAAVIPVTGYFGNRFGIKRVFILALTLFTIGSLLCGLSPHFATGNKGLNLLIVFRLIQGIGGGMLFPLGTTISFGAFPPAERAASSAVIAIPVLFAPALGPTVGGLIVDSGLKWPGIFFINVPIGIITLILLARIVRPDEKAAPGAARAGFDYSGLFLSIVGVVLVVYAFVLVSQTQGRLDHAAEPERRHQWLGLLARLGAARRGDARAHPLQPARTLRRQGPGARFAALRHAGLPHRLDRHLGRARHRLRQFPAHPDLLAAVPEPQRRGRRA